jgi:hypothetical protein
MHSNRDWNLERILMNSVIISSDSVDRLTSLDISVIGNIQDELAVGRSKKGTC